MGAAHKTYQRKHNTASPPKAILWSEEWTIQGMWFRTTDVRHLYEKRPPSDAFPIIRLVKRGRKNTAPPGRAIRWTVEWTMQGGPSCGCDFEQLICAPHIWEDDAEGLRVWIIDVGHRIKRKQIVLKVTADVNRQFSNSSKANNSGWSWWKRHGMLMVIRSTI